MTEKRRLLLTFDVEDFINPNALSALYRILKILEKHELRAIFFITGLMAEKLSNHPKIIEALKDHEIGYHSSSHSVRPTIPEYTDVEEYKKAYETSIQRETSHINPLTGEPEKEGGIYFLQDLFHPKKVRAFRAPGMCWTPPNLEALKSLGIKYDFSTNLTYSKPVTFKEITFYPYTATQQWNGTMYDYQCLLSSILRHKVTVFDLHPTLLVNQIEWDSIYYKGNPKKLLTVPRRPVKESELLFNRLELLIRRISFLHKAKLIEANPILDVSNENLKDISKEKVDSCYEKSMQWCRKYFNYNPKFIRKHFYEFFENCN
ncbi:MAG: polysaccharide deacetylase family protein [Candidatus Bathyarchaeia archaeon]